jgi:hypothetical protein
MVKTSERFNRLVRLEARAFEQSQAIGSRQTTALADDDMERADELRDRRTILTERAWRIADVLDARF